MAQSDRSFLERFLDSTAATPTLGLVYGRRRIGKSTMLSELAAEREGFVFEATRVETPVHLERLGRALGDHLGVGQIMLSDWHDAVDALLSLGEQGAIPVVLDEFGHVLAAEPSVDSIIAAALGPRRQGQSRLVLCGSAIAMMRSLTGGEAPLRGRAGLELVMQPDDFRTAATWLPDPADLVLSQHLFAVIGGVVGYATTMVDHDLPSEIADFDRWVAHRVLSPAATLRREATTLLAEDPGLDAHRSSLHHSILGVIANGSVTAGSIANRVGRPVSNLSPALARLIDAGFVVRHEDPIRAQRPLYALGDPFLQFHYAVLEPHEPLLRRQDPAGAWQTKLSHTFRSRVLGPVFEQQARYWVTHFAGESTFAHADHIGPSSVSIAGTEHQLDVVVAGGHDVPAARQVHAIGEAKAGEKLTVRHLKRLEQARAGLGTRAAEAKLVLFGNESDEDLRDLAARRADVELVDLDRLYHGA